MEIRQLEIFVTLAETKNFSKAAEQLYLTQSTVSSHMKNLEKELQKKLILRSTKNFTLTQEGITFLFYAKRILETADAAKKAIHSPCDSFLHLGASTIPSGYLLPELLSNFRKTNPNVFFDIQQGDSSSITSQVLDGSIELGLVGQKTDSSKCECIPFCADELVVIAPSNDYYRSLQRNHCEIKKLLKEPVIMREQGSGTRKAADRYLDSLNIKRNHLNIVAQNNDLEAIKQMVINGMGISIFSSFAVKNMVEQGQLLAFPIQSDIHRYFYLVYLKDQSENKILKDFVKFTCSYYSTKKGV